MALDQSALLELLTQLKLTDITDRIRRRPNESADALISELATPTAAPTHALGQARRCVRSESGEIR